MCSNFLAMMENYQGDLTDILLSSGSAGGGGIEGGSFADQWQFPTNPITYPEDEFGDPFGQLRDPLLHGGIDTPGTPFFHRPDPGFAGGGNINGSLNLPSGGEILEDEMKRPLPSSSNIFSRMLQISPASPVPMVVGNDQHGMITPSSSKVCSSVERPVGLQISSPRITGIKRRKSQAKKVVCIPAPAPANSRPTGEVVPSDLWAWRKYGQKPIKGSPYPRGYYRCSSSKGCSARKQVERSRTDPNMLVITYTSEHNHPWPTQRNALAGSTRSQASKNGVASKNSSAQKEEPQEIGGTTDAVPPTAVPSVIKEELDNRLEMNGAEFDDQLGFSSGYKPTLPEPDHSEDNFFADLGEIEADPSLDLLFTQGFDDGRDKSLDPFTFYDWATANNGGTSTTGAGEETKTD